jgi:cytochrome c biogenesis factor
MMRIAVACTVFALLLGAAFAHHGWGSYDAAKPVTVAGPVLTSKFENPHATITVRGSDKTWTVTLAPTSRMISRGATQAVIAVGNSISAYGYPSTVEKDEMRAERITVDGKTYEMR